jgi:hypothetical protein
MSSRSDRQSLLRDGERLMRWKMEAMEVLGRWELVAAKVPKDYIRLGENKSEGTGRYIEHLEARIAELEAIPPHPAFLAYVITDPSKGGGVIVKTETGWVHVGPEPPVPIDAKWGDKAWEHFRDIGPLGQSETP